MRGFNDFNLNSMEDIEELEEFPSPCGVLMILIIGSNAKGSRNKVSVPMRGFNDFNSNGIRSNNKFSNCFRPHAGF